MDKITSYDALLQMIEAKKPLLRIRDLSQAPEALVQIRVGMGPCGIAAGARPLFDYFFNETIQRSIDAVVTPMGCRGLCSVEPIVEIERPGEAPQCFSRVDLHKATELLDRYILKGESVDGLITNQ